MAVDRKRKRTESSDAEQDVEAMSTTPGTPADQEATISASMLKQEEQLQKSSKTKTSNTKEVREIASMEESARVNRLKFLIEKSKIYTSILSEKLLKQQEVSKSRGEAVDAAPPTLVKEGSAKAKPGKKRKAATDTASVATALNEAKQEKVNGKESNGKPAPQQSGRQPALITGGVMRDYQLDGLEWMVSLYENGLNGILADEMGLGKTLQTIAFLAFLRSKGVMGPFLIAAPLSTIANWVNEVRRFAPEIPVLLYHGSKDERARMRAKKMTKMGEKFPIIVTSYEIIMNDRKFLQKYQWKYIVVDEGHRLKNLNCKLIKELRSYSTANRLLLSGTPLQNNLSELWSLLNFLLPDIFSDLDSFQSWFDFSSLESDNAEGGQDMLANEEQSSVITNLHQILKPFLLRRLKVEVEKDLPPKREYLLYAPMTAEQTALYKAVLEHQVRAFYHEDEAEQNHDSVDVDEPRTKRTRKRISQRELSDDEYFDSLEQQQEQAETPDTAISTPKQKSSKALAGFDYSKLRNMLMSLRKVCNHPYQNHWPVYPGTDRYVVDEKLCTASGKMMLLKRLLIALLEKNHKILIFSQFTTMLDILEVWLEDVMDLQVCRIDGNVDQESRREQIAAFNEREDHKVFLLSTRAGGLGINLVAADTVILFDSDFNPQNDLQAMDRAHRIGQKRPVIVYRFASVNTIETKILLRAQNKRRLEKAVIRRNSLLNQSSIMEMKDILLSEDAEKIQITSGDDEVLSDQDLEKLLDRSQAAYQQDYAGDKFKAMETKRDSENDALASRS